MSANAKAVTAGHFVTKVSNTFFSLSSKRFFSFYSTNMSEGNKTRFLLRKSMQINKKTETRFVRWFLWWRLLQTTENKETIHKVSLQWRFQVHQTNRSSSQVRVQSQVLVLLSTCSQLWFSFDTVTWLSVLIWASPGRNTFLLGPQLRQAASFSRHTAFPCVPKGQQAHLYISTISIWPQSKPTFCIWYNLIYSP